MVEKTVAVIGAGVTGLVAVKECLTRGLKPTCFEKHSDIGGLWLMEPPTETDAGSRAYKTMVMNSAKDYYCYSDFPHKPKTPLIPRGGDIKPYLESYAQKFNLYRYLKLNRNVIEVRKAKDYDKTGNWDVTHTSAGKEGAVETKTFNAVMVCPGVFNHPVVPKFPSQSTFAGPVMHSSEVWDPHDFQDKTVVIIGAGISSVDMASALAPHAKHITMVSRNGSWVLPLFFPPDGRPWEDFMNNRNFMMQTDISLVRKLLQEEIGKRWDMDILGFNPGKEVLWKDVSIALSDDISQWIHTSKVKVLIGEVIDIGNDGVVLKDGRKLQADAVVLGTGYELKLPFIKDKQIMPNNPADRDWWNYLYPIHQKHTTLFLHACMYHLSSLPAISEMQARATSGIISGQLNLPSLEEMKKDIQDEKEHQIKDVGTFPGTVNGWLYALELSRFVGCYPDLEKVAKIDPKLAGEMWLGPVYPAHYRLFGQDSNWDEACKILEQRKKSRYGHISN